jgi:hypothetical protein
MFWPSHPRAQHGGRADSPADLLALLTPGITHRIPTPSLRRLAGAGSTQLFKPFNALTNRLRRLAGAPPQTCWRSPFFPRRLAGASPQTCWRFSADLLAHTYCTEQDRTLRNISLLKILRNFKTGKLKKSFWKEGPNATANPHHPAAHRTALKPFSYPATTTCQFTRNQLF